MALWGSCAWAGREASAGWHICEQSGAGRRVWGWQHIWHDWAAEPPPTPPAFGTIWCPPKRGHALGWNGSWSCRIGFLTGERRPGDQETEELRCQQSCGTSGERSPKGSCSPVLSSSYWEMKHEPTFLGEGLSSRRCGLLRVGRSPIKHTRKILLVCPAFLGLLQPLSGVMEE